MPLGTLVRLPGFKELHCPHATAKSCMLTGSNLFLIDSVSAAQDFTNPTEVPADFTGAQMTVPHPVNGSLYIKLRDDVETVQTLSMPLILSTAPSTVSSPATQPAASVPVQPSAAVPADQSAAKPGPR